MPIPAVSPLRCAASSLAVALGVLLLAGCSSDRERGAIGTSCSQDIQCQPQLFCIEGVCQRLDAWEGCEADGCGRIDAETDTTAPPRTVGQRCSAPGQCVADASCIGVAGGEGFECMAHCAETWSLCEDGSVCTPVASGEPICYTGGSAARGESCESNLTCRPGLLCVGLPDQPHHCLKACHAETGGCGQHHQCRQFEESGKGYCRHEIGRRCSAPGDCPEGLTCTTQLEAAVASNFPSGYCTRSGCADDADCPGEARCRTYPGTQVALCLVPCQFDADCRLTGEYACLDAPACDHSDKPEACNAFRDGAALCAPPALQQW